MTGGDVGSGVVDVVRRIFGIRIKTAEFSQTLRRRNLNK